MSTDNYEFRRNMMHYGIMLFPAILYFNKNRASLLGTFRSQGPSAINPMFESGKFYHVKEICIRLFFGYFAGVLISATYYGPRVIKIDAKVEEIMTDTDSI